MITEYAVACDLHLGAPNEIIGFQRTKNILQKFNRINVKTVGGGDIFDFANTKRKGLYLTEAMEAQLYPLFDIYLSGNHERYESVGKDVLRSGMENKIVFTHGDFQFWGTEKALEYRNKPRGAGFLKRGIVVNGIELFEKRFESKIDNEFIRRAVSFAKNYGATYYVCGHKHPDQTEFICHDGVGIFVLKRGITHFRHDSEDGSLKIVSHIGG